MSVLIRKPDSDRGQQRAGHPVPVRLMTKGAAELVLEHCSFQVGGGCNDDGDAWRTRILPVPCRLIFVAFMWQSKALLETSMLSQQCIWVLLLAMRS